MKKRFFIFSLIILTLSGCTETRQASQKTFVNHTYGYSLELPQTWGAIQPMGDAFTSELSDELETLGPDLGAENSTFYVTIEVFNAENAARTSTWFDFYKELRLNSDKITFSRQAINDTTSDITIFEQKDRLCDLIQKNASGLESFCFELNPPLSIYKQNCRLIEQNDKLYAFCYDPNNQIHDSIIRSIKILNLNEV